MIAAYEAPYPSPESKAGARAFPLILPTEPDSPGAAEGKRVADALRDDDRPKLLLWADSDPALPFSVGERVSSELNFPAPRKIANAGHYLQEDAGAEIGEIHRRVAGVGAARVPGGCAGVRRLSARSSRGLSSRSRTRRGASSSSTQVTVPGQ